MADIGYARVSTSRQSLDQQLDALQAAGVAPDRIYSDKLSGAREDRPGLAAALDYARDGDTLTVTSLDRLGRSLTHVITTIAQLQERGIVLRSLRESIDFSTSVGRMLAAIFAALAEYERELINERATAAREARAARGLTVGRPRRLNADKARQIRALRNQGESIADLCATFGVSRATLYRALGEGHDDRRLPRVG
jgi:DNA invertase Pin-like site-specific DNA recombinase